MSWSTTLSAANLMDKFSNYTIKRESLERGLWKEQWQTLDLSELIGKNNSKASIVVEDPLNQVLVQNSYQWF